MYPSAPLSRRARTLAIATAAAFTIALVPAGAATAAPAATAATTRPTTPTTSSSDASPSTASSSTSRPSRPSRMPTEATAPQARPATPRASTTSSSTLQAAGWTVELDTFDFTFVPPPLLEQLTPTAGDVQHRRLHRHRLRRGERQRHPGRHPSRPAARTGHQRVRGGRLRRPRLQRHGDIALIQRGTCEFGVKAINAQTAGAEAVIIFNQGNTPLREGLVTGTLFGINQTAAEHPRRRRELRGRRRTGRCRFDRAHPWSTARVTAAGERHRRAARPERRQRRHGRRAPRLGPGRPGHQRQRQRLVRPAGDRRADRQAQAARTHCASRGGVPRRAGCWGRAPTSTGLDQAGLDEIALYLNFDMVASPNYIFMVYDGDESGFPAPVVVPEGSIADRGLLRVVLHEDGRSRTTTPSSADAATTRRSSRTGSLPAACSPAPRSRRPPEQQAIWGGTAGEQYDPCYHLACDTIDNLALDALDVNADAIAAAVLTYAYSTETVNGVVGAGTGELPVSRHRPVRRGPSARRPVASHPTTVTTTTPTESTR